MAFRGSQSTYERAKRLEPLIEFIEDFARSQRHVAAAEPHFDADRVWAWVIRPLIDTVVGATPKREYEQFRVRIGDSDLDSMHREDVEFLHSVKVHTAVYQTLLAVFDAAVEEGRRQLPQRLSEPKA